jgi:hypothetical protein
VVACYYALTYVGFGAPYLMAALNGALGRAGGFAVLAAGAALTAVWTTVFTRGSHLAEVAVKAPGAAAPQYVRCGRPGSSGEGIRDSE